MSELTQALGLLIEQIEAERARTPYGPEQPTPMYMTPWVEQELFAKITPEQREPYLKYFNNWWCWLDDLGDMPRYHYGYPCELPDHPLHGCEPKKLFRLEDCVRPMSWHEKNGVSLDAPWMKD